MSKTGDMLKFDFIHKSKIEGKVFEDFTVSCLEFYCFSKEEYESYDL